MSGGKVLHAIVSNEPCGWPVRAYLLTPLTTGLNMVVLLLQVWSTASIIRSGTQPPTRRWQQVGTPACLPAQLPACALRRCLRHAANTVWFFPGAARLVMLSADCSLCPSFLPADGYANYDVTTLDKKAQCKMALQKVRGR
jgi:hypothetical protein